MGEAVRPLTCVSKTYSLPVTLDNCNYNISDLQALEGGFGLGLPCFQAGRIRSLPQAEQAGSVHELQGCQGLLRGKELAWHGLLKGGSISIQGNCLTP